MVFIGFVRNIKRGEKFEVVTLYNFVLSKGVGFCLRVFPS